MTILYRVAAYSADGLRETGGIFSSRSRADDFAATLISKHERVTIQDDALDVVAEWVDGEESSRAASSVGGAS